jgi:hypothetical protein
LLVHSRQKNGRRLASRANLGAHVKIYNLNAPLSFLEIILRHRDPRLAAQARPGLRDGGTIAARLRLRAGLTAIAQIGRAIV